MKTRTIVMLMTACFAAGAVSGCSTTASIRADILADKMHWCINTKLMKSPMKADEKRAYCIKLFSGTGPNAVTPAEMMAWCINTPLKGRKTPMKADEKRAYCTNLISKAGPAPATSKIPGELDPMYRTLNGMDLSQYKRAGDGLLLIASIGQFDLLLTEPGTSYTVYGHVTGIYARRGGLSAYDDSVFSPMGVAAHFSGYMLRWKRNKDNPVPLIGRLAITGMIGEQKLVATGVFDYQIFSKPFLSEAPASVMFMREGLLTFTDQSGRIADKRYQVNRYSMYGDAFHSFEEDTDRSVLVDPKAGDDSTNKNSWVSETYTNSWASALPEFEFVLPRPGRVVAAIGDAKHYHYDRVHDRALWARDYSLGKLLAQRKIDADHLLLTPFGAVRDRDDVSYDSNKIRRRGRASVYAGQSAFVYSYKTDKTYLHPYSEHMYKDAPVLTLPSLKDIVINGQLSVNQQCMGKTDGMVVLSGQCDPEAPGFPLTVMTQLSADQFIINVWSDINRRSTYLLTGARFPKNDFYRWTVDAFMVDKPVKPSATLAALKTGKDPFSDKLVAFASQGQEKQICEKQAVAVRNAEKALHFKPGIKSSLEDYERRYKRDWANLGKAVDEFIRNSHHSSPEWDFEKIVWDDLSKMKKDVGQRLDALKRYQHVHNSVCQPDSKRMTQLVSALESFYKDLSSSMKQIDKAYYTPAVERTKEIRVMASRVEEAKRQYNQQMAISQLMSNLQASMQSDLRARRAAAASIARSMRESREAVDAQIADVRERNEAYFANRTPVVTAPQTGVIRPVAMPTHSLDLSAQGRVYPGGRKPNRLGLKDALAQAEAKTKRLRRLSVAGASAPAAAGAADTTPGATARARNTTSKQGTGGAAICVASKRNTNNVSTDLAYFYSYGRDITELAADAQARKLYSAEYSSVPSCMRSDDSHVGALVVIVWEGTDYSGAKLRTYGMGFGRSTGEAEKGAVNNLADRNWDWTNSMGYRVVYAKQY